MKKFVLQSLFILFFTIAVMSESKAQEYVFAPSKTYTINLHQNKSEDYYLYIINKKTTDLTLHWVLLRNTLDNVSAWSYTVCDNINCFTHVPDNSDMYAVHPNDSAYFKLSLDPGGKADTGSIQFVISDKNNPSVTDTVTYLVNTMYLSVKAYEAGKQISIYPNPATDYLNLDFSGSLFRPEQISIYNVVGEQVMVLPASAQNLVNISNLPAGAYVICFSSRNGDKAWKQFYKAGL